MTVAYFDCFAGAAGDMIVAALLDAGADFAALQGHLERLRLSECRLRTEEAVRGGIRGSRFHVEIETHGHGHDHGHDHAHRGLDDILKIIAAAALPARAADRAGRIFRRLAQAEAKVHRIPIEQVHFHEVGAADSIMDIVGAAVAMELLGIDRIFCSAIPLGSGFVDCAHGRLPVPAPATAELLKGAATVAGQNEGEATTPTAAAILTALAESFGSPPPMAISAVGYGAGSRDGGPLPNLLRVLLGELSDDGNSDTVVELSANIDDCTGEVLGGTIDRLLSAGCLDAWACPIVMKKSRPAWMISALCLEGDATEAQRILFSQTTTFGVRRRRCDRSKLNRRHVTVETPYGAVRVKVGSLGSAVLTASPEYADCASAADAHHVPVKEVLAAAAAAWRTISGDSKEATATE